jgi:hypothetical protein
VRAHGPKSLTRRQVLAGGGLTVAGGLTLAGLGGYAWPHPTADSTPAPATPDDTRGVLHFVTRSDLNPPVALVALETALARRSRTAGRAAPGPDASSEFCDFSRTTQKRLEAFFQVGARILTR